MAVAQRALFAGAGVAERLVAHSDAQVDFWAWS